MSYTSGYNQQCINVPCSGGGGVVPATIPGPGTSPGSGPGSLTYSNILGVAGGDFASLDIGVGAPGDPFSLADVVLDVESSTLEAGATLIDRTPYDIGTYTYAVGVPVQAVNPTDANLTRFTFTITGTWGANDTDLVVAFGIQNPSGGTSFAGYAAFRNGNPA